MRTHLITATLALLPAAAPAHPNRAPHITPTVVLHKQADVIRRSVPDAAQYFVKTVKIGKADFRRLRDESGFEPEEEVMRFYYGEGGDGSIRGVVLFPQLNTRHGPMEVGLALGPDGTVRSVTVTKATVETKPWVNAAVETGFLDRLIGMAADGNPREALRGLSKASLGEMPYYMAEVALRDVERGLALYRTLYRDGDGAP